MKLSDGQKVALWTALGYLALKDIPVGQWAGLLATTCGVGQ